MGVISDVTVLHVDDDSDFADVTADVLEREDGRFTVETATSTEEALRRLDDGAFDCVVSDYDMPERNGIDFLAAVRDRRPDLPFILFAENGSEEVASDAIAAGVSDYLRKGSEAERYELLANRIENAVAQARSRRQLREQRRRLERLHEATRELMAAETPADIAERATAIARDVVGLSQNGIYYYDAERDALVPAVVTDAATETVGDPPVFESGEGVTWTAYETGDVQVYADIRDADDVYNPDTPIRSEIHVPLGEYGVLVAGSTTTDDFAETDITSARILAANVEAALSRADREQKLRRQRAELERHNERLEEFTDVVSHDLRNPLEVAKSRVELARAECDSDHLDVAATAHERMATLIETLLALAEEGTRVQNTEAIELSEAVEECWQSVETGAATLVTATDRTIRADRSRLKQLLENLIGNAVEHGSTGNQTASDDAVEHGSTGSRTLSDDAVEHGGDVTITVGDLDDGFYVADDGSEISPDERDEVFQAGFSTAAEGTGFGLHIVREIAEAHGWEVSATDSETGGARFEVTGVDFADR